MSRTVAALYDSRAEAETAQARLRAQLRTEDVSILSQQDQASLSGFRFSAEDQEHYRRALAAGGTLLCATVQAGEDPDRIVRILEDSSSSAQPSERAAEIGRAAERPAGRTDPARLPTRSLFVGEAWIARGDARVTYTAPEGSRPAVTRSAFEPPAASRFEDRELVSAGLFRDRTIEASEMDEIPVIDKRTVVREEVVIRKTTEDQTEIVRDTVRRTRADVSDLEA